MMCCASVRVAELDRRDVDRDLQVRRPGLALRCSACSTTLMVSGPIRPVFSAASMKASASRKPRVGERQRASASKPTSSRDGEIDQRLKEGDELAILDAAADVLLELHAVGQLALQFRVEPGEAVPAGRLAA